MHPAIRLAVLPGAYALVSCATPALPAPALPMVRLHNASGANLANVAVTFDRMPVAYGLLPTGATSSYRMAERAYRYARIEATVAGRPIVIQPIDFVGETRLAPGFYTFRLTLDAQTGLRIDAITDATPPL